VNKSWNVKKIKIRLNIAIVPMAVTKKDTVANVYITTEKWDNYPPVSFLTILKKHMIGPSSDLFKFIKKEGTGGEQKNSIIIFSFLLIFQWFLFHPHLLRMKSFLQ
jgi:hypothetical protein